MIDSIVALTLSLMTAAPPAAAAGAGPAQPAARAEAGAKAKAPRARADAGTAPADAGTAAQAPAASEQVEAEPAKAPMAPEVKALVDRMQGFYEKTSDFTTSFRQDYLYKSFKRTQTSTGKIAFKKPALMRWDYEKPAAKTIILAGEKVYMFDPGDGKAPPTLTKGAFNSSQLSASVTFLWGRGKLADEFAIAQIACDKCQGTLLELTPLRVDPRFKKVRFEVDPKTATVTRSIVFDHDGNENAITFSDIKTNTGIAQDHFTLTPPENTVVNDYTQKP